MPKLIEGQLNFLQMVSRFSFASNSIASGTLRRVVEVTARQQELHPDLLPSRVNTTPTIEASSGKVVSTLA